MLRVWLPLLLAQLPVFEKLLCGGSFILTRGISILSAELMHLARDYRVMHHNPSVTMATGLCTRDLPGGAIRSTLHLRLPCPQTFIPPSLDEIPIKAASSSGLSGECALELWLAPLCFVLLKSKTLKLSLLLNTI